MQQVFIWPHLSALPHTFFPVVESYEWLNKIWIADIHKQYAFKHTDILFYTYQIPDRRAASK